MKLFFFKSIFDNQCTSEASMDLSWAEMMELFDSHIITENKEDVPLFTTADYNLIDNSSLRRAENLISVNCIVLDYDGGTTIDEAISTLEGLVHLGYTSHSNMKDGVTEKFRVIVPLSTPCPKAEWDLRKDDVVNLFPGIDPSSVMTSRCFYLPSCPQALNNHSFSWNSQKLGWANAVPLNWELMTKKAQPLPVSPIDTSNLMSGGTGKVIWATFNMVQFFKDINLYQKQVGPTKHNVTCPNCESHTNHSTGGTCIWQTNDQWPSFMCSHSHCAGFDVYAHFKSLLGPGWMKDYCKREKERLSSLGTATQLMLHRKLTKQGI